MTTLLRNSRLVVFSASKIGNKHWCMQINHPGEDLPIPLANSNSDSIAVDRLVEEINSSHMPIVTLDDVGSGDVDVLLCCF